MNIEIYIFSYAAIYRDTQKQVIYIMYLYYVINQSLIYHNVKVFAFNIIKLQWNLTQTANIFSQQNAFEENVWKMLAILYMPQCVEGKEKLP